MKPLIDTLIGMPQGGSPPELWIQEVIEIDEFKREEEKYISELRKRYINQGETAGCPHTP